MSSSEFDRLKQAIEELKISLMGFSARDDGGYTPEELLKCQAFIVFSHAEVQIYFERISRQILAEVKTKWNSHSTYSRVMATLIAFRLKEKLRVPHNPVAPIINESIRKAIETVLKEQDEVIGKNNGIKRTNVSDMLTPLGVLQDDWDEQLLIQLDQTGEKRGDMVHKSSRVALRLIRDPFTDELKEIMTLVEGIKAFDNKLYVQGLLPPS